MLYCAKCTKADAPKPDCVDCVRERQREVYLLAREVYVRALAREPGKVTPTNKDHAVEAFIASDDFLTIAAEWREEGRDQVMSKHPSDKPEKPST